MVGGHSRVLTTSQAGPEHNSSLCCSVLQSVTFSECWEAGSSVLTPCLCFWNTGCASMQGTAPCIAAWARGRWLHRGSLAGMFVTSPNNFGAMISPVVSISATLPSNTVSEIRCHSCQSSTIHLSHKAIGCDSKHSPSAKLILKNYLKANGWKTDRLLQMGTMRPVPVLICLRYGYKVTQ